VAVRLAPPRLLEAQPASERRHLRPLRYAVVGFPAVRRLELRLRDLPHARILKTPG